MHHHHDSLRPDWLADIEAKAPQPSSTDIASEGYPEITSTVALNLVLGVLLLLLFELGRSKRSVYGRRLDRARYQECSRVAAREAVICTI